MTFFVKYVVFVLILFLFNDVYNKVNLETADFFSGLTPFNMVNLETSVYIFLYTKQMYWTFPKQNTGILGIG